MQGDRIDLRGVDARSTVGGDQAFSFIGSSAFHKKADELRFEIKSGDTFVQGDINGDGTADFRFVLDTVVNLKGGDFLLFETTCNSGRLFPEFLSLPDQSGTKASQLASARKATAACWRLSVGTKVRRTA